MSKFVTSESKEEHESRETSGKRGVGDDGKENGEGIIDLPPAASSSTLTNPTTAPARVSDPAPVDDFMATNDFKRLFIQIPHRDTLPALRFLSKAWMREIEKYLKSIVETGGLRGKLLVLSEKDDIDEFAAYDRIDRLELITGVIFLLNITKVGNYACVFANLGVVVIPEGVERIGEFAFGLCRNLTNVSFPRSLTSIGYCAFNECSVRVVDFLHTNLRELGDCAFWFCSELKSMTIPDSLQKLGVHVFRGCSNLVPSNINDRDSCAIVAHLRLIQS